MGIVEDIINKYYFYRNNIFWGLSIFFLLIIIIGVALAKKNRKYFINKLINCVFCALIIWGIGVLFYFLELTPKLEYLYFNVLIFILAAGAICLHITLQYIMFRKFKLSFLQAGKYMQYIIYFQIFLLAITAHLEIIEWFIGTLGVIGIEVVIILFDNIEQNQKSKIDIESDYANPDLLDTREKQLNKFIITLEQQKYEPYAIMISGDWGVGKSSFVLALEERLKDDSFIWIRAGSEKSVSEIMLEISEHILEELKKSNILIEKGSTIEKYFMAFSDLLDNGGLGIVNKFSNILTRNNNGDSKDYINSKLEELNKTIYLIIDDLDRCDIDYQLKMFKVIRESTELKNCKTIFLVDKTVFLNEKYNVNYIEKYISYTLDLCEVSYQEIAKKFIDEIFKDEFFIDKNNIVLKDRDIIKTKEVISNYPTDVIEILNRTLKEIKESIIYKKEDESSNEIKRINELSKTINEINKNIIISRKVKNYLKGIKRDIINLNNGLDEISNEFHQVDWLRSIIQVQFIKNMLPDIYSIIESSKNIEEFENNNKDYGIDLILELGYGFPIADEKKKVVLNSILFKIHTIDFSQFKTRQEKYYSELNSNKAEIKNIIEYVFCAKSYYDLEKY